MLSGTVNIGGHEWNVTEEKRGGPLTQLLSLIAVDAPNACMQIRLGSGREARSIEEVQLYAADPAVRWFTDRSGLRWEARIVVQAEANGRDRELVKFISENRDVREGDYGFTGGLGLRSDDELIALLENAE